MRQNASLPGLLGGMKGLALEECTRRDPTQFHILVVAYRNTAHYSIKAQQSRCLVRWASLARFALADCHRMQRPAAILSAQYALRCNRMTQLDSTSQVESRLTVNLTQLDSTSQVGSRLTVNLTQLDSTSQVESRLTVNLTQLESPYILVNCFGTCG